MIFTMKFMVTNYIIDFYLVVIVFSLDFWEKENQKGRKSYVFV